MDINHTSHYSMKNEFMILFLGAVPQGWVLSGISKKN